MQSLYDRIGGEAAVTAAVGVFYDHILADDSIKHFFTKVDMTHLRQMQKQFLTFAFGGSTKWNGRSMRAAHKKMDLNEQHFQAVA